MELSLSDTIELAKEYHKGQLYGGKDYFDHHLLQVQLEVNTLITEELQDDEWSYDHVALLHDIIEDTAMTEGGLLDLGYSEKIVAAVVAITKKEGQSRKEYLRQVKQNPLAHLVKKADTMVNLRNSYLYGDYERVRKYSEQLTFLFKE